MKRLVVIAPLLLLLTGLLPAQVFLPHRFFTHQPSASYPCGLQYLRYQGWDTPGPDNGETWTQSSGTTTNEVNQSYTNTVLSGVASLLISAKLVAGNICYAQSFLPTNNPNTLREVWIYFQYRPILMQAGNTTIFQLLAQHDSATPSFLQYSSGKALRISDGTHSSNTVATFTEGTTYNVWSYMRVSDAGATNGWAWASFSTNSVRPTNGNFYTGIITNIAGTNSFDSVRAGNASNVNSTNLYDNVRITCYDPGNGIP